MARQSASYYLRILHIIAIILVITGLAPGQARAAQEIVLISDQSKIIKLPVAPATVLIGNPSVADVTTDGRSLFFHPRGFGLTNVVALDGDGRKLGDYLVRVIFEDSYSVSIYAPDGRKTLSCRKDCEPTLRIGDNQDYSGSYIAQAGGKNSLAANQAMGEDMSVPGAATVLTTTSGATPAPQ